MPKSKAFIRHAPRVEIDQNAVHISAKSGDTVLEWAMPRNAALLLAAEIFHQTDAITLPADNVVRLQLESIRRLAE